MISPVTTELTTQQAAEVLRISRRSLLQMLDDNLLPYRKVGIRRRIQYSDITSYLKHTQIRRIEFVR